MHNSKFHFGFVARELSILNKNLCTSVYVTKRIFDNTKLENEVSILHFYAIFNLSSAKSGLKCTTLKWFNIQSNMKYEKLCTAKDYEWNRTLLRRCPDRYFPNRLKIAVKIVPHQKKFIKKVPTGKRWSPLKNVNFCIFLLLFSNRKNTIPFR